MTFHDDVINELGSNRNVFEALFTNVPEEMILWKDDPNRWSLLEIICHLYDEEKEDFGARVRSVLEDPGKALDPINPQGWVKERRYAEQDLKLVLASFLEQRKKSVEEFFNQVAIQLSFFLNCR